MKPVFSKKIFRIYTSILLAFLTFLTVWPHFVPVQAQEATRTIRVAFPVQDGLTFFDENGNRSGYIYEYLEEVAQYTGWDYEFVDSPGSDLNKSLSILMDQVANGEVDLMGSMYYVDSLSEIYNYSAHSVGTSETVLQVLYNQSNHIVIDSNITQKLRIAIIPQSKRLKSEFEEFSKINRIEPEYVYCDSLEEQVQALQDGRADAMLNTSMNYIPDVRTIAGFSPKPFYFVTGKNSDRNIIKELNAAIVNIQKADPTYSTKLYEKYFAPLADELRLSDDELAYIQEAGPLRVGVLKEQPPYQFHTDGSPKGISINMLDYITERTGLKFEFVEANTEHELYTSVQEGKVDLLAGILYNYDLAREQGLAMTRPYVSVQYVIVENKAFNKEEVVGKRLAVPETSTYNGKYVGQVTTYPTVRDCIKAVNDGKADYTYVDDYTAQYYNNLPDYYNIKLIPQTYEAKKICFGLVKPCKTELLSIFNKVINFTASEKMQTIINQNTYPKQEMSIGTFVRENPIGSIGIVSLFLLCIIFALLFGYLQRSRQNKKIKLDLQKHLRVYQLANDYFFEYDYRENTLITAIPTTATGQAELTKYDLSKPFASDGEKERLEPLLSIILSKNDGIQERKFPYNGEYRWNRFTLETIYDDAGMPAYGIGKISDIDEERKEKEHLLEKAQMDGLTQILNAETCKKMIVADLSEKPPEQIGAMILIDIDKFKDINDTYGHLEGDAILRSFAALLRGGFRQEDVIGRAGGDEFIVYLKSVKSRKVLAEKCDRLCNAAHRVQMSDGKPISISVGAAMATQGQAFTEVYQRADNALYSAKKQGRDRFEIAQP